MGYGVICARSGGMLWTLGVCDSGSIPDAALLSCPYLDHASVLEHPTPHMFLVQVFSVLFEYPREREQFAACKHTGASRTPYR